MQFSNGSHGVRFFNGGWLNEPTVIPTYANLVSRVENHGNEVAVYTSPYTYASRELVGYSMLTIYLTAPAKDVIGVKITHFEGSPDKTPHFVINSECGPVSFEETDSKYIFKSGELEMSIAKDGEWLAEFTANGKVLTRSSFRSMAHFEDVKEGKSYICQQLDLDVGENIYGLGERFGPLVKNGQSIDIWQMDGGTSTEQSYKNVPFYMSSKNYGVFVNSPADVNFEIASVKVEKAVFSVEAESLQYFVIYGEKPADVTERYTFLTGRPALPPAWSFGLWLSTSFLTNYDEETVTTFIDGMAQRDIPLSVFHFDCYWMRGNHWTDFEWDPDTFPDPKGMLERYKARGLRICVWLNPYIAQQSRLFKEGMEKGYLLKKKNGNVWQTDLWQSGMGIVDFTNPAAVEWYQSFLYQLMDDGVDCFKTDFGERIPVKDVEWFDGSDPVRMHNYYTQIYNSVVFRAIERKRGIGEAVVFARSGTAGGQMFPCHWGGDNSASYPSMAETIRAGLSLASSGYAFWSHDISGFEATAPADLYKRWAAFGLLSSHSRLHGSHSYRVPWAFDDEASEVVRHFARLKNSLMPYIYMRAIEAHELGTPILRPMFYDFSDDMLAIGLDRQYMFGGSLLVAPVLNDKGVVNFYLPEGRWTDFFSGEEFEGGRAYTRKYDYFALPLLVKQNTLLPLGCQDKPDYDFSENLTIRAYCLTEGETSIEIPNLTGGREAIITATTTDGNTVITSSKPLVGLKIEYQGKTYDMDGKMELAL